MFLLTRGGVRKRVTVAVRPIIRAVEMFGGIPARFWEDVSINGFLNGYIYSLVIYIGNNKYNSGAGMMIVMDVIDDLAGHGFGMKCGYVAESNMANKIFQDANKAGVLSAAVCVYGVEKVADDPMIELASNRAEAERVVGDALFGPMNKSAAISAALLQMYFHDRVSELRGQTNDLPASSTTTSN